VAHKSLKIKPLALVGQKCKLQNSAYDMVYEKCGSLNPYQERRKAVNHQTRVQEKFVQAHLCTPTNMITVRGRKMKNYKRNNNE
jgi:hypothetical protein